MASGYHFGLHRLRLLFIDWLVFLMSIKLVVCALLQEKFKDKSFIQRKLSKRELAQKL